MKTCSPDKESHLPALDGVRGMAILMVLLWHFWQGLPVYHAVFPKVFSFWNGFESIGQKGVDLFFVLSGFLITGILLRTKGSAHYFKTFYIRRSLRIFPLYYAVVITCLAAGVIFSQPDHQWRLCWWYLFYLQNIGISYWPASVGSPGHLWTLAVEEQFYLFWPLVIFSFQRTRLVLLTLFLVVFAFLVRAVFIFGGGEGAFYFTLCRTDTLAVGALLAILFSNQSQWSQVVLWTRRLVFPILILVFFTFLESSTVHGQFYYNIRYTIYAIFFGVVLILALSPGMFNPLPVLFQNSLLRGMGKISYAVYIFHPFIFHKIMGWLYAAAWSPFKGVLLTSLAIDLFLCIGATVLLAWMSWVFFEHPLMKLKDRFRYENRSQTPSRAIEVLAET